VKLVFTLEYNGKEFSGFQKQTNAITIQEKVEAAIKKITLCDVSINYAGRTDAGVHALSQVFDFETDIQRKDEDWINGLNSNLPESIKVKSISQVKNNFHSRFSAKNRSYAYVIYNSKSKPVFFNDFAHWEKSPLDFSILKSEGASLIGKHDFSSFRSSSCSSKNPVKEITKFSVEKYNNFLIFHITANAFLHNMVRIIMGTVTDIAKKENHLSIEKIITAKDRSMAGRTLSAKGLFFLGPEYDDVYNVAKPSQSIFDKFKI